MSKENKKSHPVQQMLNLTQIEFLLYSVSCMKSNGLTFAFFELSEIEDINKAKLNLEADGYKVVIENDTFKVFWEK